MSTDEHTWLQRGMSAAGLALCAGAIALASAPSAQAEPPVEIGSSTVIDHSDVLSDAEENGLEGDLRKVREDDGVQVYAVYVDSFDGTDGPDWARASFQKSGLGPGDVVLAIATQDRRYGIHSEAPYVDQSDLRDVEMGPLREALVTDDWAKAAADSAEELGDISGDGPSSKPGGSFTGLLTIGLLAVAVLAAVAWLVSRKSARQKKSSRGQVDPAGQPGVSTQDLNRRAAAAVVRLDDGLRAAEDELAFAELQFGQQRTQEFRAVLESARKDASRAFALRQELDDDIPEPEPQQRQMLAEILQVTQRAEKAVTAKAEAFEKMRDLESQAPQMLESLQTRSGEVRDRVPTARQTLQLLRAQYSAEALSTVDGDIAMAVELLDAADQGLAMGRDALGQGRKQQAVNAVRASENAVSQADRLLNGVDNAGDTLANAPRAIDEAVTSISADLSDAQRLAPKDAAVQAAAQRGRDAMNAALAAKSGGDPLKALSDLDHAEHELDTALQPARDAEAHTRKREQMVRERADRVGRRIRSVDDYIQSRRGVVQHTARTRISEAQRHFADSGRAVTTNPDEAARLLDRAERLGEEAFAIARSDVHRHENEWDFGDVTGFGRSYGGGYGRRHGRGGSLDVGSMVVGAIISGAFGGGRGGGWGGGGGGFSGGGGGGISSGGSF